MSEGMRITKAGRTLLAKAITGKVLNFTRAFTGDGVLTQDISISDMTALIAPKRELPIQSMEITPNVGTAEIILEMNNADLERGFWLREYGLFAEDPDTEEEVLYSYRNVGDEASYLPGSGGPDTVQYTLSLVTIIDQAENVTAQISSTNSYVTNSRLEARIASLFDSAGEINHFWTFQNGDTQKLRPATLQRVKDVLVGDHDFQNLNGRLEVVENAIAQVLLKLEDNNMKPEYHNFAVENFTEPDQIDQFKTKILSIIAGDDSIDVEDMRGIIPGGSYTISDGVNSESVKIKSVNAENGNYRIILVNDIQNSYNLATTQLFRSSAVIVNGKAEGGTAQRQINWLANIDWTGMLGNQAFSVEVSPTVQNSVAYDFSGRASFTASGMFTLQTTNAEMVYRN